MKLATRFATLAVVLATIAMTGTSARADMQPTGQPIGHLPDLIPVTVNVNTSEGLVGVLVENRGLLSAPKSVTMVRYRHFSLGSDLRPPITVETPALAPGASVWVIAAAGVPWGTQYFVATVDGLDQVAESAERNNTTSIYSPLLH